MRERDGTMVDGTDLGLIPRILFATDGAITHILEAYAREPVDLVTLSSRLADTSDLRGLGVADGERALRRISLLRGATTGRVFVHGESVVIVDRLPRAAGDELVRLGGGLLDVLSRHGIGTFRETVDAWDGEDPAVAARLGVGAGDVLVGRTYHVVVGGRPVAWITERFPRDGFSSPAGGAPASQGAVHRP